MRTLRRTIEYMGQLPCFLACLPVLQRYPHNLSPLSRRWGTWSAARTAVSSRSMVGHRPAVTWPQLLLLSVFVPFCKLTCLLFHQYTVGVIQ